MRKMLRVNFRLYFAVIVLFLILFSITSNASVFAIARGYASSDPGLQTGMVVALSLEKSTNSSVERASPNNSSQIVGVVTTVENSLVSVSSGNNSVLVESEGQVQAYVSDINGAIVKGDLLVLSPLKGILMKKKGGISTAVLGIVTEAPTETSIYSYQNGNRSTATKIAKTKINLNNQSVSNEVSSKTDSTLAKIGKTISGKDISEIRVLAALILFVIVLIAEGAIIYGAISSAITSLGRNPLGRIIINQELIKVIVVALIVMLVGLGAVYGVLRA